MDLGDKKALIFNCLRLGTAFNDAALLAECTLEEQAALEADAAFMARVSFEEAALKRELLTKLTAAMKMNASIGNTTEVRWMLERLDRDRWGSGGNLKLKGKGDDKGFTFSVEYVDGSADKD